MNYLAHIALSQPNSYSLVGNLLGDFCKGVQVESLPKAIRLGLANHRAVDHFTDHHPLVRHAKSYFSAQRRRFAGIALDVVFDHFLIRHWPTFYHQPFSVAKQQIYRDIAAAEPLMPPAMAATMRNLYQTDWFAGYEQLAKLGYALDRIAQRIRFTNQFSGMITEIEPVYSMLERDFLKFYPQLQYQVQQLALEQNPVPSADLS